MRHSFARNLGLAAAIALGGFALAPAAHASDADFKMVNKTGYQIDSVYVGPAASRSWGNDIMGRDALADGEAVNISFPRSSSTCSFDIKVKYHDGDTAEWSKVDLCQFETISLFWDGKATRAVGE